jgi:hypothetical protein
LGGIDRIQDHYIAKKKGLSIRIEDKKFKEIWYELTMSAGLSQKTRIAIDENEFRQTKDESLITR